jgi:phytoene dehydrogenase-like protein
MKKVIIIGAGIAGLSAGTFAQRSGFDVTILESHSIAGGNCTSWKRKGYLFEGGMHWLAGTSPQNPLHQLWRSIGALDDTVTINYSEPFMEYRHNGTPIRLYRDVNRTEQDWLALSPVDEKEIKALCDNIRKVQNGQEPDTIFYELSREEYVNRFSHEGIKEFLLSVPGEEQGIPMLLLTCGNLANGEGGFPEGGSLPFVGRIVKTFESLGGQILYKTPADKIIVENGKAVGVIADGKMLSADAVIVSSDTMAIDKLFDSPPKASWIDEMQTTAQPTMCVLVSLGINADLKQYPTKPIFKLNTPFSFANQTLKYLYANNYASDPAYSPNGKTAMTIQLAGDTYDFWKMVKEEGRYADEKQKLADKIIAAIAEQIPETAGKIEVCDIATPLTYERYCGNWKGSWMTAMTADMRKEPYPATIDGLDGVYFAGFRMIPPGGLPPALLSGQIAVQYLCANTKTEFVAV